MKMGLSVVIPAYNESANIARCLYQVSQVLTATDWDWEVIIVNDGSQDLTGPTAASEIARLKLNSRARVLTNEPNQGYGGSLKQGFYAARKEFVAFVPADNQFDFSEIHRLVQLQQATQADIVSGIRPLGGKDEPHRLVVRWAWNTLLRAMFGYLASDVDCGFKLFRRKVLDRLSLPSDGAMIDTQLFAGARARGMTVAETEVTHLPRTAGKSTGGNLKVWIRAWRELAVFWWQLKQEILVERGVAVFRWEAIVLGLILAVAAFVRLYHIDSFMTFLGDEGRDAMVMRDILLGRHFPAIGPGTSIGNMYLGPLYYYLTAPSLALFNFSPVGPAVQVALIGLLTVALIWWIGRQWFGRKSALVVASLYALSPTVIVYSRSSWNPNIMPFFALLCIYGIWKVWRLGYWRWLVICALSFAFVLNSHYLGLLLLPALGLFWLLAVRKYRTHTLPIRRATTIAAGAFFLLMSPLLVHDLRHNWQNFSSIGTFFRERQTTVNLKAYKAIPNLWPIWTDVTTSLMTAKQSLPGQKVALFLAVSTALVLVLRRSPDLLLVVVWLGTGILGLGLYKQHIYDHYYGFFFPAPFLLLGFTLEYLQSSKILRLAATLLLLLLLVLNLKYSPLAFPPNNQLARTRSVTDFISEQSLGRPFNLALIAKSNYDASYRYFLSLNSGAYLPIRDPSTGELQVTGQLFVICESLPCQPINHPLAEIASFGWAKIDEMWDFPWGVELYRLISNPTGR